VNADVILAELVRLIARRGELTEALEQTNLAIARQRGMFEVARRSTAAGAVAAPAAPGPT
jgi:hypothetical protein